MAVNWKTLNNVSQENNEGRGELGTEKGEWSERESNPRHKDFQSFALPTELSDRDNSRDINIRRAM